MNGRNMTDIQLRQYQQNDVDAIYEAVMESKAELSPWMLWCHENYSRKDAVTWVEGRPGAWERNESWSFVVVEPIGTLLGT